MAIQAKEGVLRQGGRGGGSGEKGWILDILYGVLILC